MLPEIWEKVVASDGQYFQWYIFSYFLKIKHFHKKKQQEIIQNPNIIRATICYIGSIT